MLKGEKMDIFSRLELSIMRCGENNPAKRPEVKEKMSKTRLRLFKEGKIKPYSHWEGKKLSKKHRENISLSGTGKHKIGNFKPNQTSFKKGQIPWNKGLYGYHIHSEKNKEICRQRMRLLNQDEDFVRKAIKGRMKRPTKLEKQLMEIIEEHNLPYRYTGDGSFLIGFKNPDFINCNGQKIAIEVYADIFKKFTYGTVKRWKEERIKTFRKYGWKVIFFDENELKNKEEVMKVILCQ